MTTRYVNPDATPGGNGTTNATSGANAAYASLSLAEAALPATLSDTWEIICETAGSADTTAVLCNGVTTSATNTLHVYASVGHRHDGKWHTGKYRLDVAALARALDNRLANTTFSYLQARTTTAGAAAHCFFSSGVALFNACIAAGAAAVNGNGFNFQSAAGITARNCIAYGCADGFFTNHNSIFQNCTSINNGINGFIRSGSGSPTATNCYAGGNATEDFTASIALTTCASSDTSGTAGLRSIAVSTSTGAKFVNVTSGSQDFHLQSGSALIDVGTDLSGTFTADIDGVTRTGTWDIGADEFASSAASYSVTGSGGLAFAGSDAPRRGFKSASSGGVTFGGTDAPRRGTAVAGAGGLAFAGATTPLRGRAVTCAGGVAFGGAAAVVRAGGIQGAGSLAFAGTAGLVRGQVLTGEGGVMFTGVGPVARGRVQLVAGVVLFSGTGAPDGTPVASGTFSITGSGAVVFGGQAGILRAQGVLGTGALEWSGAAALARGRIQPVDGGVVFQGAGPVAVGRAVTGTGGLTLTGSITPRLGRAVSGSGALSWGGAAGFVRGQIIPAAGGLVWAGAAGITFGPMATAGPVQGFFARNMRLTSTTLRHLHLEQASQVRDVTLTPSEP